MMLCSGWCREFFNLLNTLFTVSENEDKLSWVFLRSSCKGLLLALGAWDPQTDKSFLISGRKRDWTFCPYCRLACLEERCKCIYTLHETSTPEFCIYKKWSVEWFIGFIPFVLQSAMKCNLDSWITDPVEILVTCKHFHHLKNLLFKCFLGSPGRLAFWIHRNGNSDLYGMVSVTCLSGCWESPEPLSWCSWCIVSAVQREMFQGERLQPPQTPLVCELLVQSPGICSWGASTVTEGSRKWWCEFTSVSSPLTLWASKRRGRGACRIGGSKFKMQSHHVLVRLSGLWSLC